MLSRLARTWVLGLSALLATAVTQADTPPDDSLTRIQQQGQIRVALANEIPYGYTDLSGNPQGVGPEVAQQVLQAMGITDIHWTTTAFSSLIPGLQARHFDMAAAEMAILPQRCTQVLFSEPNSSYGEGLLVPRGNPNHITSFEYFIDHDEPVAIMAGADQLDILNALGVPHNRIVTIANNADAISTISTGRAAAYAATGATVAQLAKRSRRTEAAHPFQDPVLDGEPVRSWGAFAFHPQAQSLVNAFNQALLAFRDTPEWADIMTKHGFAPQDMQAATSTTQAALCQP